MKVSCHTFLTAIAAGILFIAYSGWVAYVYRFDRALDFYVYYIAGHLMSVGRDAYTIAPPDWVETARQLEITNFTLPYRYPPHTAAMVALLQPLGPHRAMLVWGGANSVAMVAGALLVGSALGGGWWRTTAVVAMLLCVPSLATLLTGQVNGLLFLALSVAFYGLTRRRNVLLGSALAAGTVLKVTPLALILYLVWRRNWTGAFVGFAGIAVLSLAFSVLVGWVPFTSYVMNSIHLASPDAFIAFDSPTNQTLTGGLMRLINADTALLLGKVGALILVMVTAALCWPKSGCDDAMPAEFALIIAALNVIPPYSWYHQMVLLQIPFLTALALAHRRGNSAVPALVSALFVLMNAHGILWKAFAPWPALTVFPLVYSLTLWVVLGYYIADAKWLSGRNSRRKGNNAPGTDQTGCAGSSNDDTVA